MKPLLPVVLCMALCATFGLASQPDDLAAGFVSPPDSAKPATWWHWMNGNVTKQGITADLEAMQRVGIRNATIVVAEGGPAGLIRYATPQFGGMVKFAAEETKRLGLTLGLENCAGWSSSGGPWVKPAQSMLDVVTSEETLAGPADFSGTLPQPETRKNFYRDIRVIAFPALEGDDVSMEAAAPDVTASVPDFRDVKSGGYQLPIPAPGQPQYLQFEFAKPFAVRTIQLTPRTTSSASGRIEVSDDGRTFRTLRGFGIPDGEGMRSVDRHEELGTLTCAVQPVTARFYRIVFTAGSGEDGRVRIARVNLSPAFRLDNYLAKCDGADVRRNNNELGDETPATAPDAMVIHAAQTVDLTANMDAAGKLTWHVPAGKWTVLRIGYTTNGMTNHAGPAEGIGLECDKLSRDAARAYWNGYMAGLAKALGPLTGTTFKNTLIDSYEVGNQNWSPDFPAEFKKRCGYDLLPYLPVYTGRAVESPEVSERVLWDVRRVIADLWAENYYGGIAAAAHGSGMTLDVEPYGNGAFDEVLSGRDADRVMGEFWWPIWWSNGDMGSVKLASSIAHIYGKRIAGAESFTSDLGAWEMSPRTMKTLGDDAFVHGINSFTFHRYTMQPYLNGVPGVCMGHNGSNIERTNTWWEQGRAWMQYLSRCQYLLQQGRAVSDVLLFEGDGAPVEPQRPEHSGAPPGYDYDNCDTDVILHRVAVKNGNLVLPDGTTYRVLLMADEKKMTPVLLRKLKELADAGATIVCRRPEGSPGLIGYPDCDEEVRKLTAELWDGGKILSPQPLETVFAKLNVKPDFQVNPHAKLLYVHRRVGNREIYFVSNQMDIAQRSLVGFRVTGKTPELWHPDTGEIEKVAMFSEKDGCTWIPMRMDPTGSVFVVFEDEPPPRDHPVWMNDPWAWDPKVSDMVFPVLKIQRAVYSVAGGNQSVDVTAKLASLVTDGAVHIKVNGVTLGADPAPGWLAVKQLVVDYTLGRQSGTKTVPDGESLDLGWAPPAFPGARLRVDADGSEKLEAWQWGTYAIGMADGKIKNITVAKLWPRDVPGPWQVTFPPNWGAPPSVTFDKVISWSDSPVAGVKYFSGTATYTKTLSIPAAMLGVGHHLYLDLGDVQVIAEVKLNGKDLGILWKPPYAVDITSAAHAGDNALEVRVTNLWPNRIIGDQQLPEDSQRSAETGWLQAWPQWLLNGKPSPTGRFTFSWWRHWTKASPLFPSGLIGPVTLRPSVDFPL